MRVKLIAITLFLILLLGFLLRVYHLPLQAVFDADQEFNVNFAKSVLTVFPIQLIGQGISVQGLFVGPWYYYFLTPFLALTRLHPIGQYYASIILSLVTIADYYYFVSRFASRRAGLLAAFLRAILSDRVTQDLYSTPAFAGDLLILLTWWCLYQYWHGRQYSVIPLGFVFGLYTSIHPALFPFYFVFLVILAVKRRLPNWISLFGGTLLFILAISPLILFEFFHQFLEIRRLFSLNTGSTTEVKNLATVINYVSLIFQMPGDYFSFVLPMGWKSIFSGGAWSVTIYLAYRGIRFWKDRFHTMILFTSIIVYLLYYFLLPVHAPDYYFLGIKVLFFMYFVSSLFVFWKNRLGRLIVSATVIIAVIGNVSLTYQNLTRTNHVSLQDKDNIVREIVRRQPDNRMILLLDTDLGQAFGFSYLEQYYGVFARSNPQDPVYTIYVPKNRAKQTPLVYSSGDIGLGIQ